MFLSIKQNARAKSSVVLGKRFPFAPRPEAKAFCFVYFFLSKATPKRRGQRFCYLIKIRKP